MPSRAARELAWELFDAWLNMAGENPTGVSDPFDWDDYHQKINDMWIRMADVFGPDPRGAGGGDRTHTSASSPALEAGASTSSATPAQQHRIALRRGRFLDTDPSQRQE